MSVRSEDLDALVRAGHLDARAWRRAREAAGLTRHPAQWQRFLTITLALGAALLLGCALVFFIAYNWERLGRLFRLALVESAVVITAVAAFLMGARTLAGRAAYLTASLGLGAMLAFIGQTYQTGADPWQLFAAWTALLIPWALAAHWAPIWAIALVTANLAIGLHFGERLPLLGWIAPQAMLATVMAASNVAAAVVAERWGPRGSDGVYRLVPRLAMLISLGAATAGMVFFVFDERGRDLLLAATYVAVMAFAYWMYRHRARDLLLLSAWALSVIVVVTCGLARLLGEIGGDMAAFWLISLWIIGASAYAAHWIRGVAKEGS
jgi:uncharacterized membrane protein